MAGDRVKGGRFRALPKPGDCKLSLIAADHEGWLLLDGRPLGRHAYPALFEAIGPAYGGDGSTTFALPNLAGRYLRAAGAGRALAEAGGAAAVTLTVDHLPEHTHSAPLKVVSDTARLNLPLVTIGTDMVKALKSETGTTGKAGSAKPQPVPVEPPFLALNVFVYAGM